MLARRYLQCPFHSVTPFVDVEEEQKEEAEVRVQLAVSLLIGWDSADQLSHFACFLFAEPGLHTSTEHS